MSSVIEHLPIAFGSALLLLALFLILRRSLDANVLPMLLIGAALIFVADKGILNLKFGASGVEVTRTELKQAKEDNTAVVAKIEGQLTEQKKLLDETRKTLADLIKTPDIRSTSAVAPDIVSRLGASDTRASPDFANNSKYSVLIFYRSGQKAVSDDLTAGLLAAGFQSAAASTDLSEVVPELAGPRQPGTIIVAAKSPGASFMERVKSVVQSVASKHQRTNLRFDGDEWTFRRGDVQIYLF